MLQSCSCATATAEFVQNRVMCKPKLEKSCILQFLHVFSFIFFISFMSLFGSNLHIFLCKIIKKKVLNAQENDILEGRKNARI